MKFESSSPKETEKIGEVFGKELVEHKNTTSQALIIALHGNLGAGKTVFTKGFARGVGGQGNVLSPTFLIMRRFPFKKNRGDFKNMFHIDAYRIKNKKELIFLGFKKIISDPQNMVIIEWPSKIRGAIKKPFVSIKIEHGEKLNLRNIDFSAIE